MYRKLATVLALVGLARAAEEDWTGEINIKTDAGLGGTVTVVNDTAIMIKDYTLKDASAPALHWWGATDEDISKGFRVHEMRVSETSPDPSTLMISLDSGKKASDFTYFGLWCETLKANFGEAKLQKPGASQTGDMTAASTPSPTDSGASLGRGANTGAAVVVAGAAVLMASYLA